LALALQQNLSWIKYSGKKIFDNIRQLYLLSNLYKDQHFWH